MTDPISDMLTRIRNAQAVSKETVVVPFSKMKFSLAQVLEKKNLIKKVSTQGKKIKKVIEISLSYRDGEPIASNLKRVSKQGRRVYIKCDEIKPVRQGYGLMIISTSQGLMTGEEARKNKLGGEIICEIW